MADIVGTSGNDVLPGGAGDDIIDGRGGWDAVDYSGATGPLVVDLGNGAASGMGADVLIGIRDVWSGEFSDVLIGNDSDNMLIDDLGYGNDSLFGGLGDDQLEGGWGTDTAYYLQDHDAYVLTLTNLDYFISGPEGTDWLFDIERLHFKDTGLAIDLEAGQAGANAVRIIGAAFDAPTIEERPDYVGIGLSFFDSGMSVLAVCQLVIGVLGNPANEAFVNTVYENVVGAPPSQVERDFYVGLLQGSGGTMTQAELLMLAANTEANAVNIDLAGLQHSGVEFV
jgi:serralysin